MLEKIVKFMTRVVFLDLISHIISSFSGILGNVCSCRIRYTRRLGIDMDRGNIRRYIIIYIGQIKDGVNRLNSVQKAADQCLTKGSFARSLLRS